MDNNQKRRQQQMPIRQQSSQWMYSNLMNLYGWLLSRGTAITTGLCRKRNSSSSAELLAIKTGSHVQQQQLSINPSTFDINSPVWLSTCGATQSRCTMHDKCCYRWHWEWIGKWGQSIPAIHCLSSFIVTWRCRGNARTWSNWSWCRCV